MRAIGYANTPGLRPAIAYAGRRCAHFVGSSAKDGIMDKKFNITGTCFPDRHYMVDISDRVAVIKKMVDNNEYFCINRGRQYGKTTTLRWAARTLASDYLIFLLSFEGMDDSSFQSLNHLAFSFLNQIRVNVQLGIISGISNDIIELLDSLIAEGKVEKKIDIDALSIFVTRCCTISPKRIVLMIDEVDQAGNHSAFIEFLGFLRKKYLTRDLAPTFQSVILAGVYDVRHLKMKIRPDAEHQYNSPWNIATSFDADMSFTAKDIEMMLQVYENDHCTGMDIPCIAQLIVDYTSGYPFLVSKICKLIDESDKSWNRNGIVEAVKVILNEKNTLFDDMAKKLRDFPKMKGLLRDTLYGGEKLFFSSYNEAFEIAAMFNYVKADRNSVKVANRILESWLYNLFLSEDTPSDPLYMQGGNDKNQFIENGQLNVERIIQRFIVHYHDIYGDKDERFHEREGRKYFMFYVKPIINGVGNYYIEAETRDQTRTDMIIDYLGKQYIIEMKIWRGDSYNTRGEKQLSEYLDYYHQNKGYMVSFCFNKNKTIGVKSIQLGDKVIVEGVV